MNWNIEGLSYSAPRVTLFTQISFGRRELDKKSRNFFFLKLELQTRARPVRLSSYVKVFEMRQLCNKVENKAFDSDFTLEEKGLSDEDF